MEQAPLDLSQVFTLEPHGPDTYVAVSPKYEWGRIYGGLVVAQALWAATQTVRSEHAVHSLHAYFILAGEPGEPVRYEVDRVRNGRSFSTRRVLARQSGGAILTLECSFQVAEDGLQAQSATFPEDIPPPEELEGRFDAGAVRRDLKVPKSPPRTLTWTRFPESLGDDPRLQACGLAYLSDLNPMDGVVASYPGETPKLEDDTLMCVSLDHAMWFHRPVRADDWVLLELDGHGFMGNRALSTGPVFQRGGTHVATIAQEGLLRDLRYRKGGA